MKKNSKRKIIRIAVIICVLGCVYCAFILRYFNSPINLPQSTTFVISANESVNTILDSLFAKKILSGKFFVKPAVRFYLKLSRRFVMKGNYHFEKKITPAEVIAAITEGSAQEVFRVTYPEGISVNDISEITQKKLGIPKAQFMYFANSDSLRKAHKISASNLEGYLFPATYVFIKGVTARQVIDKLLNEEENLWNTKFAAEAEAAGKSKHEILTLASIVESETPNISERPRIAGVYLNRLRIGMRLEADPTVQYAIGGKKHLTYADLEYDSPYNTYKYAGLPPGPINNPSESSIAAAINPERNNFLFFVAVGDSTLSHRFSSNFAQHKKNITLYRNMRKSSAGK